MRVLLIYAHPSSTSFAAAIRDRATRALTAAGHEVDLLDLYAEGFDPVLSLDEWRVNSDPTRNEVGIEAHVARLRRAEALVLCFPTWWYGMPAIMKGWLDRVWVTGVAFHLPPEGGSGQIRPGLTNIKRLAVVTTHGAPGWFIFWLGNPDRRVLFGALARLIAPGAPKLFLTAYRMDTAKRARLERFLDRVERAFLAFGP